YLFPDLFLVTTEHLTAMGAGTMTMGDLVVEVLSPSSAMYDRTAKADTYAALGVRELWLVDLERKAIEQRVLADGRWDDRPPRAGIGRRNSAPGPAPRPRPLRSAPCPWVRPSLSPMSDVSPIAAGAAGTVVSWKRYGTSACVRWRKMSTAGLSSRQRPSGAART